MQSHNLNPPRSSDGHTSRTCGQRGVCRRWKLQTCCSCERRIVAGGLQHDSTSGNLPHHPFIGEAESACTQLHAWRATINLCGQKFEIGLDAVDESKFIALFVNALIHRAAVQFSDDSTTATLELKYQPGGDLRLTGKIELQKNTTDEQAREAMDLLWTALATSECTVVTQFAALTASHHQAVGKSRRSRVSIKYVHTRLLSMVC